MQRYHPLLVALHWLMALMILVSLAAGGLVLANMPPDSPDKVEGLGGHMIFGIAIGVLLILRLVTRTRSTHPPQATTGHAMLDRLGSWTHWGFYVLIAGMVLTGLATAFGAGLFPIVYGGAAETLPPELSDLPQRAAHGVIATLLVVDRPACRRCDLPPGHPQGRASQAHVVWQALDLRCASPPTGPRHATQDCSAQSLKGTNMKMLHIACLGALIFPMTAAAWETGRELSEVNFASIDTTGNGLLDYGEVSQMTESIALSADSDENELISFDEFMAWDFGYAYLADQDGDADRYAAVKRVMFAVQDLDGDGEIDARELRLTTRWSFERADFDGNAVLSESEFLDGWTPIVMLKAGRGS